MLSGPPFESSLPILVACSVAAVIAAFVWTRTQATAWIVAAIVAIGLGVAAFAADRLVVTDREFLQELFPRLAQAAERADVAMLLAAIDPGLRPVRDEAEKVMKQVKPTQVAITRLEIAVDPAKQPPEAVVDMIVRVTGNLMDPGGQGTALAELRVFLHKKDGRWLVCDAEVDQAKPGRSAK